jgi:ribosomal protein L12E/L44/L45/RPP1/RPP2
LSEPPYETPPRTHEELQAVATAPPGLGLPGDQVQEPQEENVPPDENEQEEDEEEDEEEEEESDDVSSLYISLFILLISMRT